MNTCLRNTISKLHNAVSLPVIATRDALREILPKEITLGKRKILLLGLYKPPSYSKNDFL